MSQGMVPIDGGQMRWINHPFDPERPKGMKMADGLEWWQKWCDETRDALGILPVVYLCVSTVFVARRFFKLDPTTHWTIVADYTRDKGYGEVADWITQEESYKEGTSDVYAQG